MIEGVRPGLPRSRPTLVTFPSFGDGEVELDLTARPKLGAFGIDGELVVPADRGEDTCKAIRPEVNALRIGFQFVVHARTACGGRKIEAGAVTQVHGFTPGDSFRAVVREIANRLLHAVAGNGNASAAGVGPVDGGGGASRATSLGLLSARRFLRLNLRRELCGNGIDRGGAFCACSILGGSTTGGATTG